MKPAEGRSILHRPGLYHPLSSSLPRALGLRAWLLGGSGARRRPLRLPGRLNSGLAGGKRCRGGGLVGRQGRAFAEPGLGEGLGGGPGSEAGLRTSLGLFPADPAAATMVPKSDQLLIVVSILEGERGSLQLLLPEPLSRVMCDRSFVNLTNPVISAFVVPEDLFGCMERGLLGN